MAQNLVVDGKTFYGVDYIGMLNAEGKEIQYHEKTNIGTGVVVATIGEKEYYTVEDALAEAQSGETVNLIADSTEDVTLVIPSGATLNLQSYSLKCKNVIGLQGSTMTATPNSGKLFVAKGNIILPEEAFLSAENATGDRYILPIWSPADGCYLFSLFAVMDGHESRGLFIDEENKKLYFQFKHGATGAINQSLLINGASDNDISILVVFEWEDQNGLAKQEFVYNDEQIAAAVGPHDYTMRLNNYDQLNMNLETLVVCGKIVSGSGATAFGKKWTVENAKELVQTEE